MVNMSSYCLTVRRIPRGDKVCAMSLRDRIRASVDDIKAHGQRLVQLNIDLLKAELQQKTQRYGAAVGLFVGAALVTLYAIGFALATITVALDLVMPLWLALLIVTAVLFLIVLILALVGRSKMRQARTPSGPEAAKAEAQATVTAVRAGVDKVRSSARSGGTAVTSSSPTAATMPTTPPPATPTSGVGDAERPSTATMPTTPPPGASTATMPTTPPPAPPAAGDTEGSS